MINLKRQNRKAPFQVIKVILMISIFSGIVMFIMKTSIMFQGAVESGFGSIDIYIPVKTSAKDVKFDSSLKNVQTSGQAKFEMSWLAPVLISQSSLIQKEDSIIYILISLIIAYQLYQFIQSLNQKSFQSKNTQRIYNMGFLMIAWWAFAIIRHIFLSNKVREWNEAYQYDASIHSQFLSFGIVLIIIAWVYREGVMIQKENELTI